MPMYRFAFPRHAAGLECVVTDETGTVVHTENLGTEIDETEAIALLVELPEDSYVGTVEDAETFGVWRKPGILDLIASLGGGGLPLTFVTLQGSLSDVPADLQYVTYSDFENISGDTLPSWLDVSSGVITIETAGQYSIGCRRVPSVQAGATPIYSAQTTLGNEADSDDLVLDAHLESLAIFDGFSGAHSAGLVYNVGSTKVLEPKFRCRAYDDQGDPVTDALGSEGITIQIAYLGAVPS